MENEENKKEENKEESLKDFISKNENEETKDAPTSLGNVNKPDEEKIKSDEDTEEVKKVEEAKEEKKVISLGTVKNREFEGRQSAHDALTSKYGWQKIHMDNLPSRRKGLDFYEDGISLFIRSADTPQVRHWSEINEEDAFSIDNGFNEMLLSCSKIQKDGEEIGSFKDLLEEDRIYVLLEIRALTYPEPEHNLVFEHKCEECEHKNELKLENEYFQSIDIDKTMAKYYNHETKSFIVRTKSFGEIEIKPPTVGIMQGVSKYLQDLRKAGDKLDMTFIKILPYIAESWKGLNAKRIKEISVKYYSWDELQFGLMLDICEKARVGVDTQMFTNCKSCGAEVAAPITFPGGVKAVFVISDFSSELL